MSLLLHNVGGDSVRQEERNLEEVKGSQEEHSQEVRSKGEHSQKEE